MYDKLPVINYDGYQIRDLTIMIDIVAAARNNATSWDNYIIVDGETPDTLAQDFYGSPKYNWLILLLNDIQDPFFDWPLSQAELLAHVTLIFGVGNEYLTHHWELDGLVVNSTASGATAISNYVYQETLNEENRKIKILKEEWLPIIEKDIKALIG